MMSVSLQPSVTLPEWGSKSELHYWLLQPFSRIALVIREDNVEARVIDGMAKYKVEQMVNGLKKRRWKGSLYGRKDLFANQE
jgi:hypothetical protein